MNWVFGQPMECHHPADHQHWSWSDKAATSSAKKGAAENLLSANCMVLALRLLKVVESASSSGGECLAGLW